MSKETVIVCPNCQGAVFTPTMVTTMTETHHLVLTCKRCSRQMQFAVEPLQVSAA